MTCVERLVAMPGEQALVLADVVDRRWGPRRRGPAATRVSTGSSGPPWLGSRGYSGGFVIPAGGSKSADVQAAQLGRTPMVGRSTLASRRGWMSMPISPSWPGPLDLEVERPGPVPLSADLERHAR